MPALISTTETSRTVDRDRIADYSIGAPTIGRYFALPPSAETVRALVAEAFASGRGRGRVAEGEGEVEGDSHGGGRSRQRLAGLNAPFVGPRVPAPGAGLNADSGRVGGLRQAQVRQRLAELNAPFVDPGFPASGLVLNADSGRVDGPRQAQTTSERLSALNAPFIDPRFPAPIPHAQYSELTRTRLTQAPHLPELIHIFQDSGNEQDQRARRELIQIFDSEPGNRTHDTIGEQALLDFIERYPRFSSRQREYAQRRVRASFEWERHVREEVEKALVEFDQRWLAGERFGWDVNGGGLGERMGDVYGSVDGESGRLVHGDLELPPHEHGRREREQPLFACDSALPSEREKLFRGRIESENQLAEDRRRGLSPPPPLSRAAQCILRQHWRARRSVLRDAEMPLRIIDVLEPFPARMVCRRDPRTGRPVPWTCGNDGSGEERRGRIEVERVHQEHIRRNVRELRRWRDEDLELESEGWVIGEGEEFEVRLSRLREESRVELGDGWDSDDPQGDSDVENSPSNDQVNVPPSLPPAPPQVLQQEQENEPPRQTTQAPLPQEQENSRARLRDLQQEIQRRENMRWDHLAVLKPFLDAGYTFNVPYLGSIDMARFEEDLRRQPRALLRAPRVRDEVAELGVWRARVRERRAEGERRVAEEERRVEEELRAVEERQVAEERQAAEEEQREREQEERRRMTPISWSMVPRVQYSAVINCLGFGNDVESFLNMGPDEYENLRVWARQAFGLGPREQQPVGEEDVEVVIPWRDTHVDVPAYPSSSQRSPANDATHTIGRHESRHLDQTQPAPQLSEVNPRIIAHTMSSAPTAVTAATIATTHFPSPSQAGPVRFPSLAEEARRARFLTSNNRRLDLCRQLVTTTDRHRDPSSDPSPGIAAFIQVGDDAARMIEDVQGGRNCGLSEERLSNLLKPLMRDVIIGGLDAANQKLQDEQREREESEGSASPNSISRTTTSSPPTSPDTAPQIANSTPLSHTQAHAQHASQINNHLVTLRAVVDHGEQYRNRSSEANPHLAFFNGTSEKARNLLSIVGEARAVRLTEERIAEFLEVTTRGLAEEFLDFYVRGRKEKELDAATEVSETEIGEREEDGEARVGDPALPDPAPVIAQPEPASPTITASEQARLQNDTRLDNLRNDVQIFERYRDLAVPTDRTPSEIAFAVALGGHARRTVERVQEMREGGVEEEKVAEWLATVLKVLMDDLGEALESIATGRELEIPPVMLVSSRGGI